MGFNRYNKRCASIGIFTDLTFLCFDFVVVVVESVSATETASGSAIDCMAFHSESSSEVVLDFGFKYCIILSNSH